MPKGGLDSQLKNLPAVQKPGAPPPGNQKPEAPPPGEHQKTLQQVCREEIENLHGIFV